MGASKHICPNCGRKMKQQFIGLFHCKCGTSWKRDIGFFERTPDMVFALEPKYVIPGVGAVGIENSFLVTESGLEKITLFNEEIIEL